MNRKNKEETEEIKGKEKTKERGKSGSHYGLYLLKGALEMVCISTVCICLHKYSDIILKISADIFVY